MKVVKKIVKGLGILLLILIAFLVGIFIIYDEELPIGKQSVEADALAQKMWIAINHQAYENTRFLEWTFNERNHYLWDKEEGLVTVSWKDYTVRLDLIELEQSTVLKKGELLHDSEKTGLINKANAYFNNDSFWLVAPNKLFDPGTERRLVILDNGEEALLVTYTAGGNTPGDSYLWLLEESGLPKAFKMWVSILPIGGLEAKWKTWKTMESGALLPTEHSLLFLEMDMGFVRAWN